MNTCPMSVQLEKWEMMRKGFLGKGKFHRTRELVTELLMILQCITVEYLLFIYLLLFQLCKNIRNIFKQ